MKAGRFDHQHDEDDSPVSASGDEETYAAPSPKKSKRGAHKRVVTMPINDGGGFRSKGEVYAPSDSWSWRKYGQKPIKGSPYPRGYYRCSSSKGCPARKQVERSRHDPTTLLITYACDHNHPLPAATARTHCHRSAAAKLSPPSPPSTPGDPLQDECAAFAELAVELGWLCGVGSTVMEGAGTLVGPVCAHVDVGEFVPIGEEDRVLFGDLGDLPESAVVARWCRGSAPGNNAFGCQCHRAH